MKKKKLNWEELEKKATYNPIIEETEDDEIKTALNVLNQHKKNRRK